MVTLTFPIPTCCRLNLTFFFFTLSPLRPAFAFSAVLVSLCVCSVSSSVSEVELSLFSLVFVPLTQPAGTGLHVMLKSVINTMQSGRTHLNGETSQFSPGRFSLSHTVRVQMVEHQYGCERRRVEQFVCWSTTSGPNLIPDVTLKGGNKWGI